MSGMFGGGGGSAPPPAPPKAPAAPQADETQAMRMRRDEELRRGGRAANILTAQQTGGQLGQPRTGVKTLTGQ